ncbi:MAG: hypothetical protein AB9866_22800 [Syntrophobacteraceae bacterium]
MKGRLFLAVLFVLLLGFFSQAMAYKLSSVSLQYRVYENGNKFNRLHSEVQDDLGNPVSDLSSFQDVQLYKYDSLNKKWSQIKLSNKKSLIHVGKTGWYDVVNGQWMYPAFFYTHFVAQANFTTTLVNNGKYRIVVTYDNQRISSDFTYTKRLTLPFISEASFKTTITAAGDLIVRWTAPTALFNLTKNNPTLSTSSRAALWAYNGDTYVGYWQVKIGTHMEEAFFSKAFLDDLKSIGADNYTIVVSTRTNDHNNRSHSNERVFVLP